jgi:hypothetical protein
MALSCQRRNCMSVRTISLRVGNGPHRQRRGCRVSGRSPVKDCISPGVLVQGRLSVVAQRQLGYCRGSLSCEDRGRGCYRVNRQPRNPAIKETRRRCCHLRSEAWNFKLPGCLVSEEGSKAEERSAIECMPIDSRANGPILVHICRKDACWCRDGKFPWAHRRRNALTASEGSGKRDHGAETQALATSAETSLAALRQTSSLFSLSRIGRRTKADKTLHGQRASKRPVYRLPLRNWSILRHETVHAVAGIRRTTLDAT